MTTDDRPVLVVGSTGTVGAEVVAALRSRAVPVRVLVRDAARAPADVEAQAGDLRRPEDVRAAARDVRAVFTVSPHIPEEEACVASVVEACREEGARLVFVGSHVDAGSALQRWLLRAVVGLMLPRFRPKWRASEGVRRAGIDSVLLMPTNFFQNDAMPGVLEAVRDEGVYRYPVGRRGMNRVDSRDIGEAAARALTDGSVAAGAYPLVGPETLDGPACAAAWSAALGREVVYDDGPEAVAAWERGLEELPAHKRDDVRGTWRTLARIGIPADAAQLAATTTLLGRPPTPYADHVARVVASWRLLRGVELQ